MSAARKHEPEMKPKEAEVVLIAGAAGFLGARLVRAITDLGVQVVGIDSFKRGHDLNINTLQDIENFELIEADVVEDLPSTLRHLAISHIIDTNDVFPTVGHQELSFNELLSSSYGLRHLLDLANRNGSRLLYTSSVYIYQGLASHESLQNYYDGPELSSFFTYLEAKRYGEVLCHEYVEKFDIDVRIARLPEVYGPGMNLNNNSVLARMIRLGLDKKDLIIDEEGSREHQVLYVDDAVYGVVKLLFSDNKKARSSIFYFTSKERVSTLSVAYSLRELVDQSLNVEFMPAHRKVEIPSFTNIDTSRTERVLKWDAKVDITKGLEKTI